MSELLGCWNIHNDLLPFLRINRPWPQLRSLVVLVAEDESREQATGTLLIVKQFGPGMAPHAHTTHETQGPIVALANPAFVSKRDRRVYVFSV